MTQLLIGITIGVILGLLGEYIIYRILEMLHYKKGLRFSEDLLKEVKKPVSMATKK